MHSFSSGSQSNPFQLIIRRNHLTPGQIVLKAMTIGIILVVLVFSNLECGCNSLGTFNNAVECDQYSGTCTCQPNIHGVNCSECKDGFYHFPSTNGTDCQWCPCNFGGALPVCNKTSGL